VIGVEGSKTINLFVLELEAKIKLMLLIKTIVKLKKRIS
jgi:hypothetical protein